MFVMYIMLFAKNNIADDLRLCVLLQRFSEQQEIMLHEVLQQTFHSSTSQKKRAILFSSSCIYWSIFTARPHCLQCGAL